MRGNKDMEEGGWGGSVGGEINTEGVRRGR